MSHEIATITNPDEDDQSTGDSARKNSDNGHRAGSRRANDNDIPSREDCLQTLWRLRSLLALKVITPAQSNAITRTVQVILAETRTTPSMASALPADENILESLRAQPELLEWLEPLLSDEDVARVMGGVKDDSQPQT